MPGIKSQPFLHRSCLPGLMLGLCAMFCLPGCGSKTYEDRLKLTRDYYNYIDRLNRNLGPQYSNYGVILRAPRQFQEIPKPARRPGNQEGDADAKDPRIPEHIDFSIPGLVTVWSAGGGNDPSQKVYLYLITNYERWQTFKTPREKGDPVKIHEDLIDTLARRLRVPIDDRARGSASDRINKWYTEVVPESVDEQFVQRREFASILLHPPDESDLADREFQVYLHQAGDMKIALIYDLPRAAGGENLLERIPLSLQTVTVSPEKPRAAGASPSGGSSAPKPGGTPF